MARHAISFTNKIIFQAHCGTHLYAPPHNFRLDQSDRGRALYQNNLHIIHLFIRIS